VLELLLEAERRIEVHHLAVDLGADDAFLERLLEEGLVLALAAADDGGKDHEPRALGERHGGLGDVLHRLAHELGVAMRAVRVADGREEQAQVVVYLGHGADGRARVAARGLLLDGDGGGEPLDALDVGLGHLVEELARVGGERLHVAALSLGVERVKGERRLPRPAQPRDDGERLARYLHVDVLEVMFARAKDADVTKSHGEESGEWLVG
jgi:hypothetical protein